MIAQPTPTMEEHRPLALALLIGEVHVVQPPGRHHAGQRRLLLLLPIEPPEVDALLLQRMMQQVHVVAGVLCRVRDYADCCHQVRGRNGIAPLDWAVTEVTM